MYKFASIAVPLLILLPNLLWMVFPPKDAPGPKPQSTKAWVTLEGLEQFGRIGSFGVPFFLQVHLETLAQHAALIVMAVSLLLYYVGWVRYFTSGRRYALLFSPMGIIHLPLAISPIVYFLASAVLLDSWLMLIVALSLAVGHLAVSQREYNNTFVL